jgi:hypothetical protein
MRSPSLAAFQGLEKLWDILPSLGKNRAQFPKLLKKLQAATWVVDAF